MGNVSGLFTPERVAVVGATDREGSIGRAIVENLLDSFEGDVVPVNPNREEVLGLPCYDTVAQVPSRVDLAVVVVPAEVAITVVDDIGATDVENVVVISAGFSETGAAGADREKRLIEVATKHDLNLVGPNSVGILSTPTGLNATFAEGNALPGNISFVSQSGAVIAAVLDWAVTRNLGFKDIVSLGNEAVLDEVDFVQVWGDDPDTAAVLGYVEDIDDGHRFIEEVRTVTRHTPVVMLKSGRTEAGARAVASHTGSLAGSDRAYEAAFEQAGVIRADSIQELFDFGDVLASSDPISNTSVGIVTNAGGPGVLAADAIERTALSLGEFDDQTRDHLESVLPSNATVRNPLDIVGDAGLDRFRECIETMLAAEQFGALVVIACPTALFDFAELATLVCDLAEDHSTPLVTCLMGGQEAEQAATSLADHQIPNFFDPARAIESLGVLAEYHDIRETAYEPPVRFDVDTERARSILDEAAASDRTQLGPEAMDVLDAYGIPTPSGELVESPSAATAVASRLDGSVVMKVVSPDVVHKSDIGGVQIGVHPADVGDVYETLVDRLRAHDPDARFLGVLVQEQVDVDGVEVIAGMNRDPQFGPVLMFGLGGVFVEILEDVSVRIGPLSEREAREMTERVKSAPMLRGARGRDPVDLDAVVETLQRLSQLAMDFPQIGEFDVNPVVASPDGVTALDFRLTLQSPDETA